MDRDRNRDTDRQGHRRARTQMDKDTDGQEEGHRRTGTQVDMNRNRGTGGQ